MTAAQLAREFLIHHTDSLKQALALGAVASVEGYAVADIKALKRQKLSGQIRYLGQEHTAYTDEGRFNRAIDVLSASLHQEPVSELLLFLPPQVTEPSLTGVLSTLGEDAAKPLRRRMGLNFFQFAAGRFSVVGYEAYLATDLIEHVVPYGGFPDHYVYRDA